MYATGFSYSSPPPTDQSSRFLRLPGSEPAYSGVQNSTASATLIALRRAATVGGGCSASSGLNAGSADRPSYQTVSMSSLLCSCIARSAAVFVDAARVLPETSRMRVAMRSNVSGRCHTPAAHWADGDEGRSVRDDACN